MSKACYYETLEVERTVDEAGLKSAFRKLAMKWHPDKNPGDPACEHKFKEISEAYEILRDSQKRAAYDRFGHAAFEQGGMGGGPGFGSDFASSFSDIFEGLFGMAGRGGSRGGRERGADALDLIFPRSAFDPAWCGRRDSNPHDFRHGNLNPARLPVPPRPQKGSFGAQPMSSLADIGAWIAQIG